MKITESVCPWVTSQIAFCILTAAAFLQFRLSTWLIIKYDNLSYVISIMSVSWEQHSFNQLLLNLVGCETYGNQDIVIYCVGWWWCWGLCMFQMCLLSSRKRLMTDGISYFLFYTVHKKLQSYILGFSSKSLNRMIPPPPQRPCSVLSCP